MRQGRLKGRDLSAGGISKAFVALWERVAKLSSSGGSYMVSLAFCPAQWALQLSVVVGMLHIELP